MAMGGPAATGSLLQEERAPTDPVPFPLRLVAKPLLAEIGLRATEHTSPAAQKKCKDQSPGRKAVRTLAVLGISMDCLNTAIQAPSSRTYARPWWW